MGDLEMITAPPGWTVSVSEEIKLSEHDHWLQLSDYAVVAIGHRDSSLTNAEQPFGPVKAGTWYLIADPGGAHKRPIWLHEADLDQANVTLVRP